MAPPRGAGPVVPVQHRGPDADLSRKVGSHCRRDIGLVVRKGRVPLVERQLNRETKLPAVGLAGEKRALFGVRDRCSTSSSADQSCCIAPPPTRISRKSLSLPRSRPQMAILHSFVVSGPARLGIMAAALQGDAAALQCWLPDTGRVRRQVPGSAPHDATGRGAAESGPTRLPVASPPGIGQTIAGFAAG